MATEVEQMAQSVLDGIGERIRGRRKEMGWTQAELSGRAQVSPRFLGQLEKGEGNISVQRLVDICGALDLSLSRLFEGIGPGRPRLLALVGLRGAGKSSVGVALADQLGVRFVELDARVEQLAGMSLGELFELRGEAHYRELEDQALDGLLAEGIPTVVATGGSIVTAPETWRRLREVARTVWLEASPAAHLSRVQAQGDLRPMRGRDNALGELRAILAERAPLYNQAEVCLDTDRLGIDGTVGAVVDWLDSP
jgi:XRE family aerobic/anaerobic benzoate catabolism transcriptional regulator